MNTFRRLVASEKPLVHAISARLIQRAGFKAYPLLALAMAFPISGWWDSAKLEPESATSWRQAICRCSWTATTAMAT